MNVLLVSPAPRQSRKGNGVTARRWAGILRRLGHEVRVEEEYGGQPCDLLLALHARKSAASVERFAEERPDAPVVLALTGTDLYRDLKTSTEARRSLGSAWRLVVLQERGRDAVPERYRDRVRVVYQSAEPPPGEHPRREGRFEVSVLCHMRPVKDPFRAAEAVRLLPEDSRVRVVHAGKPLTPEMEERARAEAEENPRWEWMGELPREEAMGLLARSRAMVISSRLEGGANVVSEALACSVPVIASEIPGSVGMLGEDWPAYFPVGDTRALAGILRRVEADDAFRRELEERTRLRAHLVKPEREREAWEELMAELGPGAA